MTYMDVGTGRRSVKMKPRNSTLRCVQDLFSWCGARFVTAGLTWKRSGGTERFLAVRKGFHR
jgi:hypothetical protein